MCCNAEANLAALFESTTDMIWSVDRQGNLQACNLAFRKTFWLTFHVEPQLGTTMHQCITPEFEHQWQDYYDRAIYEGPFHLEYTMFSGTSVKLSFHPILSDGTITGVSVFSKDITQRKIAQEMQRHLSEVVESSENAIWTCTPSGMIFTWNRGATAIFGYASEEVIGRPMAQIVSDAVPPDWQERLLGGSSVPRLQMVGRHKNGSTLELSATAWSVRNPAGEITGLSLVARDEGERLEAEKTKALLASIVESSEDAIYSVLPEGEILSWNASAERLFGYTGAEVIGKHIRLLGRPAISAEKEKEIVETIAAGRAVPIFDTVFLCKNGTPMDVSLSISPVRDAQGRVIAAAGIARNITEKKQLMRSLTEAEKKYRTIFDDALEGIFQSTLTGQILTVNHAAARMLGYASPRDLIDNVRDVKTDVWFDPKERLRYLRSLRTPKNDAVHGYECRFKRKDGSVIWIAIHGRLVRGEKGRPLYHEGMIEDITERVMATQAMKESEMRFRSLFENSTMNLLLIEPDGGVIVDANRAASNYYGYSLKDLIGAPITLLNTLAPEEIYEERRRALLEERNFFKFQHRLASGALRDVHVYSSPVHIGGKLILYSIVFDVTEQMRAERELKENAQLLEEAQRVGGAGSYIYDVATTCWTSSLVMDEICGIDASFERTLEGWLSLIRPDQRSEIKNYLLHEVIEKRKVFDKEYRILRKNDGCERWVIEKGRLEYDGQGRPVRLYGTIKDITESKRADMALRASELRYRTTFQTSIDAITISRMDDGTIIDANHAFTQTTGYTRKEVLGKNTEELALWIDPEDRLKIRAMMTLDGICQNYQIQYRKKNGEPGWGLLSVSLIELDGVTCALSITRNITEERAAVQKLFEAQEALRISEERYRTVFQASLDCISIARLSDGVIIDINRAYLNLLGYGSDEVLGNTCEGLDIWVDPHEREVMNAMLCNEQSFRDTRTRLRRKDGRLIWVLISASTIEVDNTPCMLTILRDVSEAKAAEDRIWNLAFYDSLTQLPNRRLLLDRLRQMLASGMRSYHMHALLFIDLDNFKSLNDTYGHQNGDALLGEVAQRLVGCVRASDTVARLGGDEFIILLDYLDPDHEIAARQSETVARKILATIEKPFMLNGREYFSTSSIGITLFDGLRESTSELLQQADIAMYQAKSSGRNTLRFFAPELQAAVQTRAALEEEIRTALRAQQFYLEFQPQVDCGGLVGTETLIRWLHPQRGLLMPGTFIPVAEESGLIIPLGAWTLETACRQICIWSNTDPILRLPVAVNISARQFRQPDFIEHLFAILDRTGADPTLLKLELTESMLLDDIDEMAAKMHEIKKRGVQFSLDDFGTGYSSLSYLKRLPFDQLKIDRAFVHDLLDDLGSRVIAQTIISLGHALGLNVIAEGIETCEQRDLLLELGCSAFQGHFFGRPQPLAEFEQRWRDPAHLSETRTTIMRRC